MSLYLKQIEVGPMGNFVYLVGDASTHEVVIVDPAWQMDTLFRILEKENLNLVGALFTHSHYDHCNAVEELLEKKQIPLYVQEKEADFVQSIGSTMQLFEIGRAHV